MKPEQKKKWEAKIAAAKKGGKKSDDGDKEKDSRPNLNAIRKKFKEEEEEDLELAPDPSLEEDIDVEVESTKGKMSADANDDLKSAKKVIIKSKSKGTLGFNG